MFDANACEHATQYKSVNGMSAKIVEIFTKNLPSVNANAGVLITVRLRLYGIVP